MRDFLTEPTISSRPCTRGCEDRGDRRASIVSDRGSCAVRSSIGRRSFGMRAAAIAVRSSLLRSRSARRCRGAPVRLMPSADHRVDAIDVGPGLASGSKDDARACLARSRRGARRTLAAAAGASIPPWREDRGFRPQYTLTPPTSAAAQSPASDCGTRDEAVRDDDRRYRP